MTVIDIPGSKSVTARALFLAAAADGTTTLLRPLASDDTEGFAEGLRALGYGIERTPGAWHIEGRPEGPAAAEAAVRASIPATRTPVVRRPVRAVPLPNIPAPFPWSA
nr:hypothetical protein [Streptomyces sp. t39]